MDLNCLYRCFDALVKDGFAEFPIFDFLTGCRKNETRKVEYNHSHILIIEGIHALNPLIINGFDKDLFYKAYISVASEYTNHEMVILSKEEIRLIRRMVRDIKNRNTAVEATLSMWKTVIEGEKIYIDPYQDTANYFIDSILQYEPGMLKPVVTPLLESVEKTSEHWQWVQMLLEAVSLFTDIPISDLPRDSLLNEFLS